MTINSGTSKLDAPPFTVHRILSIEMINPNPSPTWRIEFGLSYFGTSVHNDSPANPHEIKVFGRGQTHFSNYILYDRGAGTITSAFSMPIDAKSEGVTPREGATAANVAMGVTKAQEAAMLYGSIYGWDKLAADSDYYNEQGEPIKFKHRDYRDDR